MSPSSRDSMASVSTPNSAGSGVGAAVCRSPVLTVGAAPRFLGPSRACTQPRLKPQRKALWEKVASAVPSETTSVRPSQASSRRPAQCPGWEGTD